MYELYHPPHRDELPVDEIQVDFSVEELRTAKYPHKCSVCGQTIEPGQQYTRVMAIVDGEYAVQKWHGVVPGECYTEEDFE